MNCYMIRTLIAGYPQRGEGATLIRVQDILSLTDFHRNTKAHLRRLKQSGRPEVLTINGKAELVVQDAAAYQRLLSAPERNKHVAGKSRA